MLERKPPYPHLVWDSRIENPRLLESKPLKEVGRVFSNPSSDSNQLPFQFPANEPPLSFNCFFWGDNLHLLQNLVSQGDKQIDLVYIDPPYMSGLEYNSEIKIGEKGPGERVIRKAFSDKWEGGINAYLDMLYPRLWLIKKIMAATASIYVHVDWHISHYVKLLLDEVFGRENFINEIVWCYGGGSRSQKHFQRKHDIIFWYASGRSYTFNPQYRPYSQGTLERGLTNVKGDRYQLKAEGALLQDWWTDIPKILSPTARENLKFPTQKPRELLKRLILASSQPGDLVADFFAGSGTLAEVCNLLGRRWILCDSSPLALQTSLYRLITSKSPPFKIFTSRRERNLLPSGQLVLKTPIIQEPARSGNKYSVNIGIQSYYPEGSKAMPSKDQDFSSWIEFWEVDPDYDHKTFHSRYQITRKGNRFKGPIATDLLIPLPEKEDFQVAIRVYDIFAGQTMKVIRIIPDKL